MKMKRILGFLAQPFQKYRHAKMILPCPILPSFPQSRSTMTRKTNSTWLQTYFSVCSAPMTINTKLINHYSIFSGILQRLFSTGGNPPPLWGDLLLLLQVTLVKILQLFIWLFTAGLFSEEGFPNKSGGLLFNISILPMISILSQKILKKNIW